MKNKPMLKIVGLLLAMLPAAAVMGAEGEYAPVVEPTRTVSPVIPPELRGNAVGEVNLVFKVDANGRARGVKVSESTNPQLNRLAINAIRDWRFEVAAPGGESYLVKQQFRFVGDR